MAEVKQELTQWKQQVALELDWNTRSCCCRWLCCDKRLGSLTDGSANSDQSKYQRKRKSLLSTREDSEIFLRNLLDRNQASNSIFPWLTDSYLNWLLGHDRPKRSERLINSKDVYKFLDILRSSKYSKLYYAVMLDNDLKCLVKVYISATGIEAAYLADKEAIILDLTRSHPFIVTPLQFFKTLGGQYIVTETYGSTTLHNVAREKQVFSDHELKFYTCELVSAIAFLHKHGVIHRNLTANNVGMTSDGHLRLFDFQSAYMALNQDGQVLKRIDVDEVVGTAAYMSPEMANHCRYSYPVDWWSLGVLLYYLAYGKMPFIGTKRRELLLSIMNEEPSFQPRFHSPRTIDLLKGLLRKKPSRRLGYHSKEVVFQSAYFDSVDWLRVERMGLDPPFRTQTPAVENLPARLCEPLNVVQQKVSMTHFGRKENIKSSQLQDQMAIQPHLYSDNDLNKELNVSQDADTLVYAPCHLSPDTEEVDVPYFPAISASEEYLFDQSDDYGGSSDVQALEFETVWEADGFRLIPKRRSQVITSITTASSSVGASHSQPSTQGSSAEHRRILRVTSPLTVRSRKTSPPQSTSFAPVAAATDDRSDKVKKLRALVFQMRQNLLGKKANLAPEVVGPEHIPSRASGWSLE